MPWIDSEVFFLDVVNVSRMDPIGTFLRGGVGWGGWGVGLGGGGI